MNGIYCAALEQTVQKKLRLYLLGSAAAVLLTAALEITVALRLPLSVPMAVALGLLTASAGIGIHILIQHRILPLYRTDKLMHQLRQKQAEPFEGIFKGFNDGKAMHSAVMMYKLRLDEGKRVGKEPVFREIGVPAIFGKPSVTEGTLLRGSTVESILVESELPTPLKIKPAEGRYQTSAVAVLAIVVAAALLWCGIYSGVNKQTGKATLNIAVCTPAHHEETELEVKQAMHTDGLEIVFSYTNTLDPEAVAMYLATFGAMDADILILNADQFAGVFENDAQPLDKAALTAALGFEPRFAVDAGGVCTGVMLYVPDDPYYNAHFPKLVDWFAVEKDVALVAAIRYGSAHTGNGQANLALVHLLTYLADK